MSHKFHGYRRITHKYRSGWKNLDQERYVGQFSVLKVGKVYDEGEYGDSWHYNVTIKAPKGATPDDVNAAIRNFFDTGCRCEHDCCGHVFTSAHEVKHTKRREYAAVISAGRNV